MFSSVSAISFPNQYYARGLLVTLLLCVYYVRFFYFERPGAVAPTAAAAAAAAAKPARKPLDLYLEARLRKFDEFVRARDPRHSQNISSRIYVSAAAAAEATVNPVDDRRLREQWQRSLLLESTPRGTVVMFFDLFHFGFAYYSDSTQTPTLLTAVARKYVMTFFCLDFYLEDGGGGGEGGEYISPFVAMQRAEDAREQLVKTQKRNLLPSDEQNMFYRLKKKCAADNAVVAMQNKFIYLGKLANWDVLRPSRSSASSSSSSKGSSGSTHRVLFGDLIQRSRIREEDDDAEEEEDDDDDDDDDGAHGAHGSGETEGCARGEAWERALASRNGEPTYADFKKLRVHS